VSFTFSHSSFHSCWPLFGEGFHPNGAFEIKIAFLYLSPPSLPFGVFVLRVTRRAKKYYSIVKQWICE
jgi:hypothetical protein